MSGSREQFLHREVRKFRQSKSSVYRWYTQLDRHRFVYDTCKTMKATRTRHVWVHMFTTHRLTLTLQLHNFDLFKTCRTALLRGNWQDFNWHDASRGQSAIAELLVSCVSVFNIFVSTPIDGTIMKCWMRQCGSLGPTMLRFPRHIPPWQASVRAYCIGLQTCRNCNVYELGGNSTAYTPESNS